MLIHSMRIAFLVAASAQVIFQWSFVGAQNAGAASSTGSTAANGDSSANAQSQNAWTGVVNTGTSFVSSNDGQSSSSSSNAGQTQNDATSDSMGTHAKGIAVSQQVGIGDAKADGVLGASGDLNGQAQVATGTQTANNNNGYQNGQGVAYFIQNGTTVAPASAAGGASGQNSAQTNAIANGLGQYSALGPATGVQGGTYGNGLTSANGGSSNGGDGKSSSSSANILGFPAWPNMPPLNIALSPLMGGMSGFGSSQGTSLANGNGIGQGGGSHMGGVNGTLQISGDSASTTGQGSSMGTVSMYGDALIGGRK